MDKYCISDGNSKNSLHFDRNAMTLGGGDGGNDDLRLASSKQDLCEYFEKWQEEEKSEMQEEQVTGDSSEEVPIVEDVMEGDEGADESAGVRQEGK